MSGPRPCPEWMRDPLPSGKMTLQQRRAEQQLIERKMKELKEKVKKRYTLPERNYLVDLVSRYVHVVDSPEVDSASIQEKRNAWLLIKEEFNSVKSHNPRTMKQLKKAWENYKTKMKNMNRGASKPSYITDEEGVYEDCEQPAKKRVKCDESEFVKTENNLSQVPRNFMPNSPSENSLQLEDFTSEVDQAAHEDVDNSPSQNTGGCSHPSPPFKISHTCSLAHPCSISPRMTRRLRSGLSVQTGCDEELMNLLRREVMINVEIVETERRKAEVELKLKEEELEYKKRLWDLEIKLLEKKLMD